jgi:hypothetical protein
LRPAARREKCDCKCRPGNPNDCLVRIGARGFGSFVVTRRHDA